MASNPVRCDGCGNHIQPHILREPADPEQGDTFCWGCTCKVRAEGLEPGEDFEQYKLWSETSEGLDGE